MTNLISALTLLTVLPIPGKQYECDHARGRALAWFPAVGFLLGIVLILVYSIGRVIFSDLVAAALVVALWAGLTGALHLEALADCGDGMAATTTPERRQEIMHDPHVGAFGLVAVVVVLLFKFAAVASLRDSGLLVLAPLLARWAIVLAAAFPLARTTGMAALFQEGFGRREILTATAWAVVAAAVFGRRGFIAFLAACAVVLLFATLARNRLGGMNGDVYGAIAEVVEVLVLTIGSMIVC